MIDENIEKSLKRFLKRKISVNESVVVKFLITGLIGATLTACGGGGGGGGSSSGGVTPFSFLRYNLVREKILCIGGYYD